MSVEVAAVPVSLDADLVRALSWCRLGGGKFGRPEDKQSFYRAEELGLLAHDPIWRATPQGEGVLIALGLLEPTWVAERTRVSVLWSREARVDAVAQFVRAWPEGFEDCYPDSFRAEVEKAKDEWRDWYDHGQALLFWTSTEEMARP